MDSVPYAFCLDVMGKLGDEAWQYEKMEKSLTGRWKAAARRYADNARDIVVGVNCDEGEWSYFYTMNENFATNSLDELLGKLLAMNRRFVRCRAIYVQHEMDNLYHGGYYTTCSKEDIFRRFLPFMVQQARSFRTFRFHHSLSREDARMYFDFFRGYKGFGFQDFDLDLPYVGEESEQFLSACLELNMVRLTLDTSWSRSQALEDLLLKFFTIGRGRWTWSKGHWLSIEEPEGEENEELSMVISRRILEMVVNAWNEADSNRFQVHSPWYGGLDPVLSISVPPNVTRTEHKISEQNRYLVLWSKENGSTLRVSLFWNDHYLRLTSHPDEWYEDVLAELQADEDMSSTD
uniref:DUF3396 domain-containing protein n=1 Tax=Steinernema glaseri TaxID=37863 RepID=A0A1I7Y759_9BILA